MTRSRLGTAGELRRLATLSPHEYAYVAAAALLLTIPIIGVPLLVRIFVDEYLVNGNASWVQPVVTGLVVALVIVAVLVYLQFSVLTRLSVRMSAADSTRLTWHLLRLPITDIQQFGSGDLTTRVGMQQRNAFVAGLLVPMAVSNIVTITVLIIAVVAIAPVLGVAALLVVVGAITVGSRLLRRRQTLQTGSDSAFLALSSATTSNIASIETIKAMGWETWVFDRWGRTRSRAGLARSALGSDSQRLGLVAPLTQMLGLGLLLGLGTWLLFRGEVSVGTLVAVQTLFVAILLPAGNLVWIGTLVGSVTSVRQQGEAAEELPLDVEVSSGTSAHIVGAGAGPVAVTLHSLAFGYDIDRPPLFAGIDLDVPAGSWLAIVGASGSGKSTLSRILVGELQPWEGVVLLDGVPRLEIPRRRRAERVGYVPQTPILMPGTIAENVSMFDPSISPERIRRALTDARIVDAIDARPNGLEEMVSATGHGFSGGELQRLAIARALVRDPGLLILDEATSALDPIVEVEVAAAIRARGCTCILVAHRLSTVRDAEQIVVLERGRVLEVGTFDALRDHGRFSELAHG